MEATLDHALTYICAVAPGSLTAITITILADTDYYSRPANHDRIDTQRSSTSRFVDFQVPLQEAHKTGLGSSAALVTALTGALLTYFLPKQSFDLEDIDCKARLHNLAQVSHCAAQGKVGSGFDVAAAVYGSCIYTRFSPSILEDLGTAGSANFSSKLRALVDDRGSDKESTRRVWDARISTETLKLAKGLRLVMCDVDCGSETVGMAKKVLAWRKQRPHEAGTIWERLAQENTKLQRSLETLTHMQESEPEVYRAGLEAVAQDTLQAQDIIWNGQWSAIRSTMSIVRELVREMSFKSEVPIEPPEQTALLNACSRLPGVLGGVVPGAGGFDAIALLVVDDENVMSNISSFLESWGGTTKETTNSGAVRVRMLGVREEMEGAKSELLDYRPWTC